ncbi:hypothetical protein [Nocardioides terrisoli]|uniref:hypothetical protein n=1 Tax=Nocardioides terrisoli TaxID=3388267 RepID=UPI00287BC36B|nr:hypothetical protein [Nocardioides marmorisolisilvae]
MAAPFPTRWDFILATVLIGVNRTDGTFYSVPGTGGEPTVGVFTTEEAALSAPDETFDKQAIAVSRLLAMLPAGIGVTVNPGSPGGDAGESMHVDPRMVQGLRAILPPLPAGTSLEFRPWLALPAEVGSAVRDAVSGVPGIRAVWALTYTIDDSPHLGLFAYDADDADSATVDAIAQALDATADLARLDVASVQIVGYADLPDDVRDRFATTSQVFAA